MSKLTEYLSLIPKGLKNPEEVLKGWFNVVKMEFDTLPDEEVEEILRRRLICMGCEYMSNNAKLNGYKCAREDAHCILCSCPIVSKTANLDSKCGATFYNTTNPDKEPLEVKW